MEFEKEYFYDQVRDGFFVPSTIKRAWATELDVLAEVDRIAKKNNIKYFADWGTLLGAVRHGGFVPWDDDLDIVMLRADYEKFLKCAENDFNDGFEIFTFENHPDYWQFMSRVVAKNRICFEEEHLKKYHGFPYIAGLDITVLDNVPCSEEAMTNMGSLAKDVLLAADIYEYGKISSDQINEKIKSVVNRLTTDYLFPGDNWNENVNDVNDRNDRINNLISFFRNIDWGNSSKLEDRIKAKRQLYIFAKKLLSLYDDGESNKVTQMVPFGINGGGIAFPKYYYEHVINLPFENRTIPATLFYNNVLQVEYGSYMKMVKSSGVHNYPFFQTQKDQLEKVMGFKVPGFEFKEELLNRNHPNGNGYKNIIREQFNSISLSFEKLQTYLADITHSDIENSNIENSNIEELKAFLAQMQECAINIGNTFEQVKGEGTKLVSLLENLCENIFIAYSNFSNLEQNSVALTETTSVKDCINVLTENINEINKEILDVISKEDVVFLPVREMHWDYLENYYQKEIASDNVNVYVVPLSYYDKAYDGAFEIENYEGDRISELRNIHVIDCRNFDIELIHPDRIYIQNPNDNTNSAFSIEPNYYSDKLQQYTDKLIYVPYFEVEEFSRINDREFYNMQYYACVPGVFRADKIILESDNMKAVYIEKLMEFAGESTKKIWEDKIEVLAKEKSREKARDAEKTDDNAINKIKKKFLYYISASTLAFYKEKMIDKILNSLNIFSEKANALEVTLLWDKQISEIISADYPNIYENIMRIEERYKSSGFIKMEDVDSYYANFVKQEKANQRGIASYNKMYEAIANEHDAYYGDPSPIVTAFVNKKKPVMIADANVL